MTLRGKTGHSRALANSIHAKPRKTARIRGWQALNEAGEVIATAPTKQHLVDCFGDDFRIEAVQ